MRLIKRFAAAVITMAALSACAPTTTTLAEFYGKNGGRSPNQPQANTIPHCIDATDERHRGQPRGRLC